MGGAEQGRRLLDGRAAWPPDQGFVAHDLAAAQIDHRLEVRDQPIVFQKVLDDKRHSERGHMGTYRQGVYYE